MRKVSFLFLLFTIPLIAKTNVLVFAGSSRAGSYNQKLAQEAAEIARKQGNHVKIIDLKDFPMPFYDADLEAKGMPQNAKRFRDLMIESDVIVIASPEYNGSIPAVLKNALDWASRAEEGGPSRSAFKDKKFALLSASPGPNGGARALSHLRSVIENVGGEVLKTEVTVPNAYSAFTEENIPSIRSQVAAEMKSAISF
jgi:chromate reductase